MNLRKLIEKMRRKILLKKPEDPFIDVDLYLDNCDCPFCKNVYEQHSKKVDISLKTSKQH